MQLPDNATKPEQTKRGYAKWNMSSLDHFITKVPTVNFAAYKRMVATPDSDSERIEDRLPEEAAKWVREGNYWPIDVDPADFEKDFRPSAPREQLIIGQNDRGIRFFNYSEKDFTAEQTALLATFVDIASQYVGDRLYDFVTDVVFAKFSNDVMDGFVKDSLTKVIYMNTPLLDDDDQLTAEIAFPSDTSRLLKILLHEFGHLLEKEDAGAEENLIKFARSIGWDDALLDSPFDDEGNFILTGEKTLDQFAPKKKVVVYGSDGAKRVMAQHAFSREHRFDENGKLLYKPLPKHYRLGTPTEYGRKNPGESYAETTAAVMLGDYVGRMMPETHDAWLDHLQQSILKPGESPESRPIASPIRRDSVLVERRIGKNVLYPGLPDKIEVRVS